MVALDSFVFLGNVNLVFPSLPMQEETYPLSSKFPSWICYGSGKFRGRQKISLSTNFASLTHRGKLVKPTELMQFLDVQNMWYFIKHAQNIAS